MSNGYVMLQAKLPLTALRLVFHGLFLPFAEWTDLSAVRGEVIPGKNPPLSHGESADHRITPVF
jgi:hypothetical protein